MSNDDDDLECMRLIRELTREELTNVSIHNTNPDFGGPDHMIEYYNYNFLHNPLRVTGETLLECLRQALEHKL